MLPSPNRCARKIAETLADRSHAVRLSFGVQIDSGARIDVPESESLTLRDLDLAKSHLVHIFDGPGVIESFHFGHD